MKNDCDQSVADHQLFAPFANYRLEAFSTTMCVFWCYVLRMVHLSARVETQSEAGSIGCDASVICGMSMKLHTSPRYNCRLKTELGHSTRNDQSPPNGCEIEKKQKIRPRRPRHVQHPGHGQPASNPPLSTAQETRHSPCQTIPREKITPQKSKKRQQNIWTNHRHRRLEYRSARCRRPSLFLAPKCPCPRGRAGPSRRTTGLCVR